MKEENTTRNPSPVRADLDRGLEQGPDAETAAGAYEVAADGN